MKKTTLYVLIILFSSSAYAKINWDNEKSVLEYLNKPYFGYRPSIEPATYRVKNNRDIILIATRKNGENLKYAPNKFLKDKQIILSAISPKQAVLDCGYDDPYKYDKNDASMITLADSTLLSDKKFLLTAVSTNGFVLQYLDKRFQNDKVFIIEAIKHNANVLKYLDPKYYNDKDIIMTSIENKKIDILKFVSSRLTNDRDFMFFAIKHNFHALQYASKELQNDKTLVLEAIHGEDEREKDYQSIFKYASLKLKDNREIAKIVLNNNYFSFRYFSKRLRDDKDIALKALKYHLGNFKFVSARLRDDKEIALKGLKLHIDNYEYISRRLKKDREIIEYKKQEENKYHKFRKNKFTKERNLTQGTSKINHKIFFNGIITVF